MNFIKLSVFYDYLHSPTSWLHKIKTDIKFYISIIYLLVLPYTSLQYIILHLLFFIILYKSLYIPKNFRDFCQNMIILFLFFILISIDYNCKININDFQHDTIISINTLNIKKQILNYTYNIYISVSMLRILIINLIYLLFTKFLLLTTPYNKITQIISKKIKYSTFYSLDKISFKINIAAQFLHVIYKEIGIFKKAYIIRNSKCYSIYFFKDIVSVYYMIIKQLVLNIDNNSHYISNTLHSREIKSKYIYHRYDNNKK